MRFELFIASRYLRAKRRQAVIGVITGISVAGVAAGVASLIIALAITNGFRQDLQQRLLGASAHVQLLRTAGDGIRDWRAVLAKVEKQPHVTAASPAIYEQVMISRGARAEGGVLKGVVPQYERKVTELLSYVTLGSPTALNETDTARPASPSANSASPPATGESRREADAPAKVAGPDEPPASTQPLPPLILGKGWADEIGATIGSVVLVTSPQGELTPFGMVPKYVRYKVVGIFHSGLYDYDTHWALTRLSDAQRLFGLGDLISVIECKVDNIDRAAAVAGELKRAAGAGFDATSWMEQNRQLFRALQLERVVTFITIGLIVFVAALNILISLVMMVMEKTRDIAVLMSMGAKKEQVRRVFMAQGVLIGVVGTAIGLALGYVLAWAGGHYRFITLSAEVYSIDYVPFAPRAVDGLWVAAVSIGISLVATLYPSWSAARILPAEALRYE